MTAERFQAGKFLIALPTYDAQAVIRPCARFRSAGRSRAGDRANLVDDPMDDGRLELPVYTTYALRQKVLGNGEMNERGRLARLG